MRSVIKPGAAAVFSAALVAALGTASVPASSQTVDELVVMGRVGPDGEPRSLSQPVSFRDLDLRSSWGRDELSRRIKDTARSLCEQLGESGGAVGVTPSCRDAAIRDAMVEARRAYAAADVGAFDPPLAAVDQGVPASDVVAAEPLPPAATDAVSYGAEASVTTTTVSNGPVADTLENRSRYGAPLSNAGRRTAPAGN